MPRDDIKEQKERIDGLAENVRLNRVAVMAQLFLQTSPGDQSRGWGAMTIQLFEAAAKGFLDDEQECDAGDTIHFQWELSLLRDHIISSFGLEVLNGQICLLWDGWVWRRQKEFVTKFRRYTYECTWEHLSRRRFPHPGSVSQGPPFPRVVDYLAAAIAGTSYP